MPTTTTTDIQTDYFTPCACARGNECTWVQNPHRYMHAYSIIYGSLCICTTVHVQYQEYWTTYPTPEQGAGILLTTYPVPKQGSGTTCRVSDLRVGGRHQAMPLCTLWQLQLNYALESHRLFTLSLHWQLTSKAQNGNQSCSCWGRCHVNTDWQHVQLHIVWYCYSTGQDLLFLCATYI